MKKYAIFITDSLSYIGALRGQSPSVRGNSSTDLDTLQNDGWSVVSIMSATGEMGSNFYGSAFKIAYVLERLVE
jgi:hypothetical protein